MRKERMRSDIAMRCICILLAILLAGTICTASAAGITIEGPGIYHYLYYTVTYDGNGSTGGAVPVDSNSPYFVDSTVTVLGNTGNLVMTDGAFGGWNTAADGSGTSYQPGSTFILTGNVTLYAMWLIVKGPPPAKANPWTDITYNGKFNEPGGIEADGSGNVYVADTGNNAFKELKSGSASWTDITYNGKFNEPCGIAVDGSGDVYVADYYNNAIKELYKGSASWTDICDGVSNGHEFYCPFGIAVDGSGDVFLSDIVSRTINELYKGGAVWMDITFNGGFSSPAGVAVDGSGDVYVADTQNCKVKELYAGSTSWTIIYIGGCSSPAGVAVDGSGDLFVTDQQAGKIWERVSGASAKLTVPPGLAKSIQVIINGTLLQTDVASMIYNERTMVPFSAIFDALGATVHWNPSDQSITATRGTTTIRLQIGSTTAFINGAPVTLDAAPMIVHGRTLVEAKFVSEALGYQINWDAADQRVNITGP